jgi:hypothetical protein
MNNKILNKKLIKIFLYFSILSSGLINNIKIIILFEVTILNRVYLITIF